MKATLCVLGALIFLSSITSIFNNLVVIGDASAQQFDDKYSKYPTEEYKYECQRGPFEGFFVSSVEFCDVKLPQDDDKSHQDKKSTHQDKKFDTCNANTPLGRELGLTGTQTVEVADDQLCQLTITEGVDLSTCDDVPGNNLPQGALVTNTALCTAATPAVQCGVDTTLKGVWVHPSQEATICNIEIPPPVETFPCDGVPGNNLPAGARVTNIALCTAATPAVQCDVDNTLEGVWVHPSQEAAICDIDIPQTFPCDDVPGNNLPAGAVVTDTALCTAATPAVQCGPGSLQGVWVHPSQTATCSIVIPTTTRCPTVSNMPGALVTDPRLCFAATPAVQCPAPVGGVGGTDLAGIWVHPSAIAQCNISPADITLERNPQAQCLKCADLALFESGNLNTAKDAAEALATGNTANPNSNIFTVCDDTNPRTGYNLLIPGGLPASGINAIESLFDLCLTDAAANAGTEPRAGDVPTALQENSLTTNIESEAEIPSVNAEPQNATLNSLLENPHLNALLEDPELDVLIENNDVNALLADPNVNALLKDPDVNALLKDPEVNAQLESQK